MLSPHQSPPHPDHLDELFPASMASSPPASSTAARKADARRLSTDEQRARNRLVVKRCYYRKLVRRLPLPSRVASRGGRARC